MRIALSLLLVMFCVLLANAQDYTLMINENPDICSTFPLGPLNVGHEVTQTEMTSISVPESWWPLIDIGGARLEFRMSFNSTLDFDSTVEFDGVMWRFISKESGGTVLDTRGPFMPNNPTIGWENFLAGFIVEPGMRIIDIHVVHLGSEGQWLFDNASLSLISSVVAVEDRSFGSVKTMF